MQIGLVDVDGHNFPNIPLMKLSAYHKAKGDSVEWADCFTHYDILYMAKVFTFTQNNEFVYMADKIIRGGTGYDYKILLPHEVEHCFPDYSLYGITDTAYGYLSRGCPRGCPFCIVKEKEGQASVKVADLSEWWNGQKNIKLCDPNITACPDFDNLLQQLIESKATIDFTQGLDIRLMTEHKQDLINQTKHKMLHFAWDNPEDETTPKFLEKFRNGFPDRDDKLRVYVLTNYNSTHEQDLMRIYKLKEMGYDPFVMVYEVWKAPKTTRKLQRWCNAKCCFRVCDKFENYNEKTRETESEGDLFTASVTY